MQNIFGAGVMWGTPLTDSTGAAIVNPTPVIFGTMQDVSVDISADLKLLHGSNQYPVAAGRGKGKISGKCSVAQVRGLMFNSLFFGQTVTKGILSINYDTTGAAIPATPYTITPTPPSSGTFLNDEGVIDWNGQVMTRVTGTPTTGQYSLTTGAYLFAAADTGKTVFISYSYTAVSTSANKSTVTNQPMGYAPSFRCDIYTPFQGKSLVFSLPNCIGSKFGFATKLDDFAMMNFEFEAFADPTGNVMTWATTE